MKPIAMTAWQVLGRRASKSECMCGLERGRWAMTATGVTGLSTRGPRAHPRDFWYLWPGHNPPASCPATAPYRMRLDHQVRNG